MISEKICEGIYKISFNNIKTNKNNIITGDYFKLDFIPNFFGFYSSIKKQVFLIEKNTYNKILKDSSYRKRVFNNNFKIDFKIYESFITQIK